MANSLKQELTTWSNGLDAYDAQDFEGSMQYFESIADTSKICFNIALILATIGQHEEAIHHFGEAINLDPYLAVAYYQSGVSNFLLERYEQARQDFDDAFIYLRSNAIIDYEQLGLKFKLYSCEILFNRGLSSIYMGNEAEGMADFSLALKEKQIEEHNVIDEAFVDRGHAWRVFSIPVGVLFRPSENKLRNLKTKDYLGTAKLVAATDSRDAFTGFSGAAKNSSRTDLSLTDKNFDSNRMEERTGLSRSKTSVAKLGNVDFGAPTPLRRRATGESSNPPFTPSNILPSVPPINRSLSSRQFATSKGNIAIPTPPPSDGLRSHSPPSSLPLPPHNNLNNNNQNQLPSRRLLDALDNPYDGMNLIDDYYDSDPNPLPRLPRTDSIRPTPEGQPRDRVATWARENTGRGNPETLSRSNTSHSTSTRGGYLQDSPNLSRNESSRLLMAPPASRGGEMSIARQMTNMTRAMSTTGRSEISRYQESGYEGTVLAGTEREMSKVRVKLRYKNDTRGMSITPEMRLDDFVEKIRVKFGSSTDLAIKYRDSEGVTVSIVDDDDWESAMDEAREAANGRAEGKLEIIIS